MARTCLDMAELERGCHCEPEDEDDKSFVYVESTQCDKTLSEDSKALTETVWYHLKPPKLFSTNYSPAITARQVQIMRIQLQGKRKLAGDDQVCTVKEKVNVSIPKKKSAVTFLSATSTKNGD
ncbi:unnamed protein product [Ceutorhynchus assimilis]|uniref:Uncharacterized protein n=1 Tax=Ceutorhynchus assimilis TaxID=467358 RepID=A0A9N9MLW1_9CUCU|nr:unnamed protein product [Ceutorhynchus assimilis]